MAYMLCSFVYAEARRFFPRHFLLCLPRFACAFEKSQYLLDKGA
jgi:hypothetical protein